MILRLARRLRRRLRGPEEPPDYRERLFAELRGYLGDERPRRILEIGPKDGRDTVRLLGLEPERLTLVDLPDREESNQAWLRSISSPAVQYISANLMYSDAILGLPPFDLVWCTGVLYHNPEQLRMVRRLYDLVRPGGVLALESATTRHPRLRGENCVEIIFPPSLELKKKYGISLNITHLPSARAIQSWLEMVGFDRVERSSCHGNVSRALARDRAAFLAQRPSSGSDGRYYALEGGGFVIGKAL
jgi:SAM-dependent methyltransferase